MTELVAGKVSPPVFIERVLGEDKNHPMGIILSFKKNKIPGDGSYLVSIEDPNIPPELNWPKRTPRSYFLYAPKTSGAHSHNKGTEREIMYVCLGRAEVHLWDKKGDHVIVILDSKDERMRALYIPDGIFHTVRYIKDTILIVRATCLYTRIYYLEFNFATGLFSANGQPSKYFTNEGLEKFKKTFPSEEQL